ncbi:hypothetical protein ACK3SF_00475 [Candidatus Nanosalina sp. VS9-1]|uniref:hypothetical protein n=1 Tax=Candidatus Nanosalina sp. VS9-1 TaxID=3388566 RepID=UPI0039E1BCEE
MADFGGVDGSAFDEAYEILSQENQETIEAYRHNSPTHEQINHIEEVLNILRSLRGDISQGLEDQSREMDDAISNLEQVTGLDREEDDLAHQLESQWEDFERKVTEEFERAQAQKTSRTQKMREGIGSRFSGVFGDDEEDDSNSAEDSGRAQSIVYYPDQLEAQLATMEQKFLNPLLRNEEQKTEQEQALKNLTQVLETSVELHQQANKYKMILLKAKNDVQLQEQLAEQSHIDWFNQEVMEAGSQEQRLERQVEEVMNAEKALVDRFEEASNLIQEILNIDQDIMDTISANSGEKKGRAQKAIGSLTSGENTVVDMLEFINSVHSENDYSIVAQRINDGIRPKIAQIQRMEDTDIRREQKLAEEVEDYVAEHRRLFEQQQNEIEQEERNLTPEGPVDDARNGAPPGTREFIQKIEELRDLMNQGILEDLRNAEQNYRRVYRIDQDEVENVKDFEGRAQKLSDDLGRIEEDFRDKTPFENAYQAQDGSKRLKMEMEKLMNGEDPFSAGLRPVANLIEQLQADLQKIYSDESEERNHFQSAHESLQQEVVRIREVIAAVDELESMVEEFRDPDHPRNSVNGESHPYRAYHDAFLAASRTLFDGNDREVQQRLHNLIGSIVEWINNLEQEIERLDGVMSEVINEEDIEINAFKNEIEVLQRMLEMLEETFQGDINEPIPSPVSQKIDQIDKALRKIEEKLEDLESRKEGEETEFENEEDFFGDLGDDMDTASDEANTVFEEDESMFDEEFDDDFGEF